MLKTKKVMASIFVMIMVCTLCSCGTKKETEEPTNTELPITTTYTTYVRDENGNVTKVDEGYVDDNGKDVSTIKDNENEVPLKSDEELEPGKWVSLETKTKNDGITLYQMLVYAELKKGFDFKFETMKIAGVDYYNDNYETDGKYVDGYSIKISDDTEENTRYLLTLSSTEKFTLDDVELVAYNSSNDEYSKNAQINFETTELSNIDLHKTYSSTMHFIQVGTHYYVWDQTVPKKIIPTGEEFTYKTAITPDTIVWASDGGSAEELFKTISENYKWANELNGETFDSEYATLTLEEIDGKACLVKTAREDLEDVTSNPAYVTYTESGFGTMYFVIV